ncbi:hypothetical protein ABGB18_14570 [Nonomuraea sp. B12E4]|uniref:hypothetical protein n=1 Tax=Nonomuraea sp. B12E4 TaxID=3153564 RepID=UPI00325F4358
MAGVPDADQRGRDYVAYVDGLILHRLLDIGTPPALRPGTPESVRDLRDRIRELLGAMIRHTPGTAAEPQVSGDHPGDPIPKMRGRTSSYVALFRSRGRAWGGAAP